MSKNVIITGTSSGIGFELVKLFSENNHNILAISRNNEALRILDLPNVSTIDFDLTKSEEFSSLDEILNSFENIDILINNAGHLVNKSFEETTLKDFQDVYSTNVFSVAMLIKKVIKFMSTKSNVVNISSIGGVQGSVKFSGLSAYSSSKAALNILTEMLAEGTPLTPEIQLEAEREARQRLSGLDSREKPCLFEHLVSLCTKIKQTLRIRAESISKQ